MSELDVDMEMTVKYQYLKNVLTKAMEYSKDENFKKLIIALSHNFNIEIINELVYMCLSCLALPKFFHKYGFLLLQFKSRNIQEIIEIVNMREKLEKTTKIFTEFYNKIELWERLEDEYDIKRERTKATEKLRSIFESLKHMFEQDQDEKLIQMERFNKNLEGKIVPDHIMKIIKEEMERFMSTDKHSMESNVIRNYLDILTSLPYGISTEENLDIVKAREIINETHYGMEDIKERILECIAVGKLKGKIQGKILCFVGPPGVGKTSIGESIARALNRKFIRISLGGDRDTSVLKGFRRTYVGAIPGKIVKAIKTAGSENPLILLDEIDKLAERSLHGDPSSVLLEILDPEQNNKFTDDYLDTTIDLSKVFFLCTANSVQNIQQALYDRMEIIEVSGYTFNEKKFIFEKYLKPRAIKNSGLDQQSHKFGIEEKAVDKLINDYCRESGVRSLQRYTNRIFEKIALKVVQSEVDVQVTTDILKKFVGGAHFTSKRLYDKIPRGVSIGLGFNIYGGTIMYVEASKANFSEKTTGQYNFTGNVGKVMGESCNLALTYAKTFLNTFVLEDASDKGKKLKTFFDENHIHIHFTEGAIAKDGPSAGVTITTALISLALNKPIVENLAMTGEISLGGKVI